MEALCAAAAREAEARVASCRARGTQLASRRPFDRDDLREARAALERATERAAIANLRLEHARSRRRQRLITRVIPDAELAERRQPSTLRKQAGELSIDRLFPTYLAIGGQCSEFELDAFVHSVIDLPAEERAILAHAVWEATEFPN
jgi:hypothetical protein